MARRDMVVLVIAITLIMLWAFLHEHELRCPPGQTFVLGERGWVCAEAARPW